MARLLLAASAALAVALTWCLWDSAPPVVALQHSLQEHYEAKLGNAAYVEWKSLPGIPVVHQDYKEERAIKDARSQLASLVQLPATASANVIPLITGDRPRIDGRIEPSEWTMATRISIGIDGAQTWLYLLSDAESLYLACDVPADTTGRGYDQFRFHFHIGISPLIVNERIHVGTRKDDRLGGIRQTNVRWKGKPAKNHDERWKKYPISDWRIYQRARGLASLRDHRQYEAVLDLAESGLHVGVPFRAFVEVETDPAVDDQGKFDHRVYVGQYGTQGEPKWFLIQNMTP